MKLNKLRKTRGKQSVFDELERYPEDARFSGLKPHELKVVKDSLPYGGLLRIARSLRMSYNSVHNIMEGTWDNRRVVDAAIEMAEIELKDRLRLINKINEKNEALIRFLQGTK